MTYEAWLAWIEARPFGAALVAMTTDTKLRCWYSMMEAYRMEEQHYASTDATTTTEDRDAIAARLLEAMAQGRDVGGEG